MDQQKEKADLVFHDGTVFTAAGQPQQMGSVAVRGGRIMAVGPMQEIDALVGPRTRKVALRGRMLMPGLNEAHSGAFFGARRDLFDCTSAIRGSLDPLLEHIGAHIARAPEGEFIVAGYWDPNLLSELSTSQSLARLDAISGRHPVTVAHTYGKGFWVNSRVLALAGIDASTKVEGGEVVLADGKPTGVLLGNAGSLVQHVIPPFTVQQNRAAAVEALRLLNSAGITGVLEGKASDSALTAFKGLDDAGQMSAWFVAALGWEPAQGERGDRFGRAVFEQRAQFRGKHVFPDGIKIELDGVPHFRTAAFLEPYPDDGSGDPGYRGELLMSLPELVRLIAEMDRQDVTVKMHALGDAAVRQALDALEIVSSLQGKLRRPHQLAHPCFIDSRDLPRFAQLGVVAEMSPMLWYPSMMSDYVQAAVGARRGQKQWRVRDLLDAGAPMSVATAWPKGAETRINPWSGLEALITRRNPFNQAPGALGEEQRIDLGTALGLMTLGSARAMGIDAQTGSITVGKSADLILLDRDLFAIDPDDIAQTAVEMTMFEGKVVHGALP